VERRTAVQWILAGIGAGLVLTGMTLLLRVWFGAPSFPEQILDQVLLWLPAPLFSLALARLQFLAKPLFFVTLLVIQLVVAGLGGLGYGRVCARFARLAAPWFSGLIWLAIWLAVELGALPALGISGLDFSQPGADRTPLIAMATLPGLVYGLALAFLARSPAADAPEGGTDRATRSRLTRRAMLGILPIGGAVLTFGAAWRIVAGMRQPQLVAPDRTPTLSTAATPAAAAAPSQADPTSSPTSASPAPEASPTAVAPTPIAPVVSAATPTRAIPTPTARPTEVPVAIPPEVAPLVTPTANFYVVSKNFVDPTVNADAWKLEISGLVRTPLTLTYADVLALPTESRYVTLECISNEVGGELMSTALWTGGPLHAVLARAGVLPGASTVVFTATDNYNESLTLEQAMEPTVLLAHTMNGAPLTPKHGFPARILTTGRYGMKNPKWVIKIELTNADYLGYWERRRWKPDAPVQTTARIDTPKRDGSPLPLAPVNLGGIAFAGDRGISRVEVSADGGAHWLSARLEPALSPFTWVRWMARWEPPGPDAFTLLGRAYEVGGTPQRPDTHSPFPNGASGYDQIAVTIRGS